MAMGIPVLASDTRIDRYYFGGGQVEFFDGDCVEDLTAKIEALVRDDDRRSELSRRGAEFVRVNNWDVKKHEYLEMVESLVSRRVPTLAAKDIPQQ
jgi:glycosyltransferase involved in cell wall biosynthesis